MKKNWFYLLLLMAIAVMPLTSCEKEEDMEPKRDSPLPEYTEKEEVEW
jgi:hypothetical protein